MDKAPISWTRDESHTLTTHVARIDNLRLIVYEVYSTVFFWTVEDMEQHGLTLSLYCEEIDGELLTLGDAKQQAEGAARNIRVALRADDTLVEVV